MPKFDFLVIGSGIAGLSYALKVANNLPEATIGIVTKGDENESNTKYAQGGIAIVVDKDTDSIEQHIQDTLKAGDGLCDTEVVKRVITEGPMRLKELIDWGVEFDQNKEGFKLGLEGGHSQNRILHHKDATGSEIERKLLTQIKNHPNVYLFTQHFAIDLISQHHFDPNSQDPIQCFGAYVFNPVDQQVDTFLSKVTLLATGGIGQVYQNTTNPTIATGDGIAMAYRIKARIEHMEFVQFHPTALYHPETTPSFLISEAVRGFGAQLRNRKGELFMHHYDERKELASRDIVSRAIDAELKKSGDEYLFLDCRHLKRKKFKKQFPTIYEKLEQLGINIKKDMIPVVPAAHYLCGGISVDTNGQSTVKNLFACGECTHTGLHGANRLASNSLLEALVYSHNCFLKTTELISQIRIQDNIPNWDDQGTTDPKEMILITHNVKEVKTIMSEYVGIIRSDERLERALARLKVIYEETEGLYKRSKISTQLIELRNMISVAYLIVKQSQKRKENRGGYFNLDLA